MTPEQPSDRRKLVAMRMSPRSVRGLRGTAAFGLVIVLAGCGEAAAVAAVARHAPTSSRRRPHPLRAFTSPASRQPHFPERLEQREEWRREVRQPSKRSRGLLVLVQDPRAEGKVRLPERQDRDSESQWVKLPHTRDVRPSSEATRSSIRRTAAATRRPTPVRSPGPVFRT